MVKVEELLPPDRTKRLDRLNDVLRSVEDVVADRVTVPANPPTLPTVIVEVPLTVGFKTKLDGLALVLKGATDRVTRILWTIEPLVPVTVTLYNPVLVELHVRVEVPDVPRVIVDGLIEQLAPDDGEIDVVRLTAPTNPFEVATVTVEEVDPPTASLIVEGEAESPKSGTRTPTMADLVKEPLTPVTATT